ncbi:nitrate- and nitrite sensing domain-containing protein [Streptomyces sp. URMC 129]|uniref:sensor histidine kinase n=1 Tax=Streptomyces sp. URMC 129 TaxID=3423407 RepID=UPI003F1B5CAA
MGRPTRLAAWRTIRGRVTTVLAVPTCLLLVLTGAGVVDRTGDWLAARDAAERVERVLDIHALVRELQRERGLTSGVLGGAEEYRAELTATRARTDEARRALSGGAPEVDAALRPLGRLEVVRAAVDEGSVDRATSLAFYTEAVTGLNDAAAAGRHADRRLGDALAASQALMDVTEAAALERGLMNGVFAAGRFTGTEYVRLAEVRAARLAALEDFGRFATGTQRALLDTALDTESARRALGLEREALDSGGDGTFAVAPEEWWTAMTAVVDDLYTVRQRVAEDARDRAGRLSGGAVGQLAGFLALGVLVLALAALLAWLAARSITRPLDALAREADDVAGRRLPETVRAIQETGQAREDGRARAAGAADHGADEIVRLAAALRDVERVAVAQAAEQAALRRVSSESLAHLGHRNHRLLCRQLRLITALENQETDPDALAELFELDHLATRMRRNAESLLILTGTRNPPRVWQDSVPVIEVARSAVAEVEEYRRVTVVGTEPCHVRGDAVAELSHLLAELIENALDATPARMGVEVHGWWDGAEYCLAVVDQGRGMTDADLARANARLAGEEDFLAAPTRHLGHYVAGKLAARIGAQVEVRHTQAPVTAGPLARGAGVTGYVALPPRLLTDAVPPTDPLPPPGAARRPVEAPGAV